MRATAGAAYVLQPGRDELVLRAGRGLEGRSAGPRLAVGEGVTGRWPRTGEPLRGRVGAEGLEPSSLEPTARELISVPMRTSRGLLGVLTLYDRADGRPFDAGDLQTIRTFAGQAAVAVDNVLLHQEAQRLSVTDGLTGLGNYRSFQATLTREIERASRFGRPLGLLMLDLDHFKKVNDTHGHQVGDDVLVEVAAAGAAQVREVDTVARYGGEEFVVILPETDAEGAGCTAERICAAVRAQPDRRGRAEPHRHGVDRAWRSTPRDADSAPALVARRRRGALRREGRRPGPLADGGPATSSDRCLVRVARMSSARPRRR